MHSTPVKKFFKIIGILAGFGILSVISMFALLPWMDGWGATGEEIAASLTGDELVPNPRITYTRAVSVNAPPEQIYPWIVQLGADKGGMYSYTWLEALIQCPQTNADRIHEEWQGLKVGDKVLMCANDMPPGFEVAIIEPNRAIVMGHQENDIWSDVWQFILVPQGNGTTRLVLRSRDAKEGWMWDVIRPGEFIMARGMLLTIKERAETPAETGGMPEASHVQTAELPAFGQIMSVSYETGLATSTETTMVPSVLPDDQSLFSSWHPAYAQIRFLGFPADSAYQLPFIDPEENIPRIMVFQTKDFAGYGDDNPQGFVNQLQSLAELLKTDVSPDQCNRPLPEYESALPFLPWVNMKQTFCAQPQFIEFAGGKGIRYITYYAQSPEPVLERSVFYTFQGMTNDGELHISALFPIETGIFPNEPSPCPECSDPNYNPFPAWNALLEEQLTQLNKLSESDFAPALRRLDDVVKSIYFKPQGKP